MSEERYNYTYTLVTVIVVLIFLYIIVKEATHRTKIIEVVRDQDGRIIQVVEKVV
ncbi:MAG: hypothetical protein QXK07_04060 [Desulfurococcaceae archaeon]